jgi:Zn-dependent peptidase ImmA (M78 family)
MSGVPIPKVIFRDLSPQNLDPSDFTKKTREYLGITIEQQTTFQSCETAFKAWRHVIEEASVFTFKDSFMDKFISGFSLVDDEYPIIFINNSNAFARQIFTLIHELGHILYGVNGVTDVDESYINFLGNEERLMEINCNKFAANFLVPDETLEEDIRYFHTHGTKAISEIAHRYSVSREVVLRRLIDNGAISKEYYETKAAEWNKEYLRREKTIGGGNFYLTHLSYLGEGYTKVAFENYYRGRVSRSELANHLNINARNLPKLEGYMRW